MTLRDSVRLTASVLTDGHLWQMLVPLLAAPLAALLLVGSCAPRARREHGPKGGGPAERAAVAACVQLPGGGASSA